MSPTMKVSGAPFTTGRMWWIMSSSVTPTVVSYPSMTMPSESPTRMTSVSLSFTMEAVV